MPKKLKIGAYDWHVIIEAVTPEEDDKCGQALFATNHLKVWPENLTSPSHLVGVVLHECLHVIFDNEKLEKLKKSKEDREEQIIAGFESGLISLFRDNPKFVVWMRKHLK